MKTVFRAFVLLFIATSCAAQDLVARLDDVVQPAVRDKAFMGTVLVARGADVILSKGYGSANLEWDLPNTPFTKFRLGSITKQFTAAAILLLEERGKLKVEDLVKTYIPDAPAAWDRITIFNLLTHSSGIPNFTALPEYRSLEQYVGTYDVASGAKLWIRLQEDHLTAQLAGQPELRLFAESDRQFFVKVVEATLEFQTDASGAVTGVRLRQGPVNELLPRR